LLFIFYFVNCYFLTLFERAEQFFLPYLPLSKRNTIAT
jgi:hypothetical protein